MFLILAYVMLLSPRIILTKFNVQRSLHLSFNLNLLIHGISPLPHASVGILIENPHQEVNLDLLASIGMKTPTHSPCLRLVCAGKFLGTLLLLLLLLFRPC